MAADAALSSGRLYVSSYESTSPVIFSFGYMADETVGIDRPNPNSVGCVGIRK